MMSSKIQNVHIGAVIFPNDTQWALAAKVPVAVLEAARNTLSDFLQTDGSRVIPGNEGFSVLLAFGGSIDEGEDLAIEISRKHKTSVYLLDFDDEAMSFRRFDSPRVKWIKGHPADFLESFGVTAPGYEPRLLPAPTVTVIGVVDDVSLEQAHKAMPKSKERFATNARGVLVDDESFETIDLSKKLKRRSFLLFYDRKDGSFTCVIRSPDQQTEECFAVGRPSVNYTHIDSILGETTLDGILRVLDIPHRMLFPEDDATDQRSTLRDA
jgi:hypothetical protein